MWFTKLCSLSHKFIHLHNWATHKDKMTITPLYLCDHNQRSCTYLVDTVEVGDDVESYLRAVVLELCEEQWQQVLNGTATTTTHWWLTHTLLNTGQAGVSRFYVSRGCLHSGCSCLSVSHVCTWLHHCFIDTLRVCMCVTWLTLQWVLCLCHIVVLV